MSKITKVLSLPEKKKISKGSHRPTHPPNNLQYIKKKSRMHKKKIDNINLKILAVI